MKLFAQIFLLPRPNENYYNFFGFNERDVLNSSEQLCFWGAFSIKLESWWWDYDWRWDNLLIFTFQFHFDYYSHHRRRIPNILCKQKRKKCCLPRISTNIIKWFVCMCEYLCTLRVRMCVLESELFTLISMHNLVGKWIMFEVKEISQKNYIFIYLFE